MGGRLDSTNIIREPLLSVITGIAIDHSAFLGDTVEKIAYEKAGVIKDGAPVLFGANDERAEEVIRKTAFDMGSPYYRTDRGAINNVRMTLDGTTFDFGERKDVRIGLLGSYQPLNAANVLSAIDILRSRGMDIPEDAVRSGLSAARWSARFEIISKDPLVIFDGAHNPEGIASAVQSIKTYFGDEKIYLLTGVLRDKDYSAIALDLSTVASKAFTVTPDSPRALLAEEYARVLGRNGIDATPYGSIKDALSAAIYAARRDGKPLVCLGSLYLYSSLIKEMEKTT
jgi:dihydrofolate synthase/folylpolyglutamate synthase